MDKQLTVILTLLLFPVSVYLALFPPRPMSALWQSVVSLFNTPIDIDRIRHAMEKRTLRPDPFGDVELEVWHPSPLEQLRTRTLLLRSLPPELVLQIMNLASYYTTTSVTSAARKSVANGSARYITSQPIYGTGKLKQVRVAVKGRDQGWSSFPQHYGTFEGSTSYYEMYLLRKLPVAGPHSGSSPSPSSTSGRSNPFTFAPSTSMDDGAPLADHVEVEVSNSRRTIQYNRHAGQVFETYLLHFGRDDALLQLARPGDRIAIDIVAKYQGWINAVSCARITTLYSFFEGPPDDDLEDQDL